MLNDLRRLLKVYLFFLRSTAADTREFDARFLEGREPWSRLYWTFVCRPLYAIELGAMSKDMLAPVMTTQGVDGQLYHPPSGPQIGYNLPSRYAPVRWFIGPRKVERMAVEAELHTSLRSTASRGLLRVVLSGLGSCVATFNHYCKTNEETEQR